MTNPPEHDIPCPWCQAPAGQRCASPRGRKLPIESHDARIAAYATAAARDQQTGDTK